MSGITPEQLMTTMGVLLAVFAALVTIDKVVEIFKKWRTPSTDVIKKLAADKQRLDELEETVKKMQKGSQVQCAALIALLDHELHNGNADQMEKAKDEMMKYLQGLVTQ